MSLNIIKIENKENDFSEYSEQSHKTLEPIFVKNFLRLRHYVQDGDGIVVLRNALEDFSGLGAVIVGAGPSLDNSIEELKDKKENIVIISCDAALPVLLKHNIMPNIVVVLDHSDRQVENFKDKDLSESFVFSASIINPLTFDEMRRAKSRILWFNLIDKNSSICMSIPSATGKKGAFIPGSLTSSAALQAAFWLGIKNVAFIGHDLSYCDIDVGYSKDISENKKNFQYNNKIKNKSGLKKFTDINNNEVISHFVFIAFHQWINDCLETIWPGANVYNCSGQGILHGNNIKQCFLNEFIKKHGKEGYSKEVKEILNKIYYEEKQLLEYIVAPIYKED
jgi:hypothetical protein